MKTLYLIRHAKSSWDYPELRDFERPLNKRGRQDAPFMGQQLQEIEVFPDAIISSPANRAITTARAIAAEIGFPAKEIIEEESIYQAGWKELLFIIRGFNDEFNTIILVGHNPGFTELANELAPVEIENIPTSGIFCVTFDVNNWKDVETGKGQFKLFDYPKNYSG